jgi:hypothetical protein
MRSIKIPVMLISISLVLAACGGQQPPVDGSISPVSGSELPASSPAQRSGSAPTWLMGKTLEDGQGSVTVAVTMGQINSAADSIEFEVVMDTHSVDLNMDLAPLATLTTNTGISVDGLAWTTSESGHHVSGVLSFPASLNGVSILDGATELTLTIRNVDAAERIFTWQP